VRSHVVCTRVESPQAEQRTSGCSASTRAPETLCERFRHCCSNCRIDRLTLAISTSATGRPSFYSVGMKNFLDLFRRYEPHGRTKPPGDGCGIFAGMVDHFDQDIDYQQRIRWQNCGGRGNVTLSSHCHLPCGLLRIRTQVDIDILEALARNGSVFHQAPERVVYAQAELLLQFLVRLSGLRLLYQKDRCRPQSVM
jgi:hypothetical protein